LIDVVLRHFWLLSWCGWSIPNTRSPNPPPLSCFPPLKSVPLSLNAYTTRIDAAASLRRPELSHTLRRYYLIQANRVLRISPRNSVNRWRQVHNNLPPPYRRRINRGYRLGPA